MQSTHGGFSTFDYAAHVTRVVDDRLVVDGAAHPITTLREAAERSESSPTSASRSNSTCPRTATSTSLS